MSRTWVLVWGVLAMISGCAFGIGKLDVGSPRGSTIATADTTCTGTQIGYSVVGSCSTGPTTELTSSEGSAFMAMVIGVHGGQHTASVGDASSSGWVLETFLETLFGKGRFALGFRSGLMLRKADDVDIDGDGRTDVSPGYGGIPMTLHGYYGLSPRVSTHLGIGGDIYAFGDNPRTMRIMSGLRFALSSSDNGATMIVIDVDHLRGSRDTGDYRSFGVIGGFALVK